MNKFEIWHVPSIRFTLQTALWIFLQLWKHKWSRRRRALKDTFLYQIDRTLPPTGGKITQAGNLGYLSKDCSKVCSGKGAIHLLQRKTGLGERQWVQLCTCWEVCANWADSGNHIGRQLKGNLSVKRKMG